MAVRLMQGESAEDADYVALAEILGILFQIRDDYLNLQSDAFSANKSFCEDRSEGKFSYPIIHSIQSRPGDFRLFSILRQRTDDIAVKNYALAYIMSTGSFAYCEREMDSLLKQAREKLGMVRGMTSQIEGILDMLEIKSSAVEQDRC